MKVSQRDVSLLRVIGENGGTRLRLLQELLAVHSAEADNGSLADLGHGTRTEAAARYWADRMVRGGYLKHAVVLRASWFTLTPAGARLVGLVDDDERPTPRVIEAASWIEHTTTVGRLRLHLAREYPEATWKPERDFWAEQRKKKKEDRPGWRRPDGALDFSGGRLVGLEVELTRKHADDYRELLGKTHPKLTEVWWYCPPELVSWLRRSLQAAAERHESEGIFSGKKAKPFEVRPLPGEVWP